MTAVRGDLTPIKSTPTDPAENGGMKRSLVVILVMFLFAACNEQDATETPDAGTPPGPDATPVFLAPPPEGAGFQVSLAPFSVPPGQEQYYCYRLPLPEAGEFDLARLEGRLSVGAHHLLISTIEGVYTAGQGPCSGNDFGFEIDLAQAFANNLRFLSGSQTPYAADPRFDLTLEPGMAFRVRPATTLLLQLHWLNAADADQQADTAINFWYATAPPTRLLESIFFYHGAISLPPHAQATAAGRCLFPTDVEIVGMVSHMHSRGVGFTANRFDGALGELVYAEDDWREPVMKMWSASGLLGIGAGAGLEYRCQFDNQTDQTITTGETAGDEMCMLIGLYAGGTETIFGFPGIDAYPANPCTAVP